MWKLSAANHGYREDLERLFSIESYSHDDAKRKLSMMSGSVVIGIIFLCLLGSLSIVQGGLSTAILDLSAAVLLTSLFILLRSGRYLLFCLYSGVGIIYVLFLLLFISGGVAGNGYLWSYLLPLFTFSS